MGSSPMPYKKKTTPKGVVFFLVDDIGLEGMMVSLGQALASGAHPRRIR